MPDSCDLVRVGPHIWFAMVGILSVTLALFCLEDMRVVFSAKHRKGKEKSILHTHAAHLQAEEREFTGRTKYVLSTKGEIFHFSVNSTCDAMFGAMS